MGGTMQRILDYVTVAAVIAVMMLLFRLSRFLLSRILRLRERRGGPVDCNDAIRLGFRFLLAGMLFLPLATALAARADNRFLIGGTVLHLSLVAVSIVLFSFAEDLFAGMKKMPPTRAVSTGEHFRSAGPLLIIFWLLGSLFLSPIFYSALTLVLGVFYLFALAARPGTAQG